MDLLSWPEVFAADYVIKSIIISLWAPLLLCFIFFFLCSWVERWVGTGVHKYKCRHKHTHTCTAEQLHSRWHNGHTEDSESFYNQYTQKYMSGNMVKKGKCLQSKVLYTLLTFLRDAQLKITPKTMPNTSAVFTSVFLPSDHRPWIGDLCQPLLSNRHRSSLWFCQVCCYV